MRLIRSKVFRAIPELDRFSDDQCRRFVSAANSSWRRRLFRWTLVGLAGFLSTITACIGIVAATSAIQDAVYVGEIGSALLFIFLGTTGFAIALVPTLPLRDYLLRRSIRKLIKRCGACPKCHYSLLGMRISPDKTITCPECGLTIDVDESLGELATDEQGAPVYQPLVARDHAITKQIRRRRRRRFFLGAAAVVALLVLAAGAWWTLLLLQASRANRDRPNYAARLSKLQQSVWPPASADAAASEFQHYLKLVQACSECASPHLNPLDFSGDSRLNPASGNYFFDHNTLLPGADPVAIDKQSGAGAFAASRAFTLDTLWRAKEQGLIDDLRALLTLKSPIRPMTPPPGESMVGLLLPDLGFARATARFNAARMILALENRDRAEYMEALEECLVVSQIVERQGLLIDRLVAVAIQSLVYKRLNGDLARFPDAAWIDEALAVLKRRSGHPKLSMTFEVERLAGLDSIAWFFSDSKRIAKAHLGIPQDPFTFGNAVAGSIGTYSQNQSAYNDIFDAYAIAADASAASRPPVPTGPSGLLLLDQLLPSISRSIISCDALVYEERRCHLTLASELFRLRHGRLPENPTELRPLLPHPIALTDPFTDKPFRFSVPSGPDGKLEFQSGDLPTSTDKKPAPPK